MKPKTFANRIRAALADANLQTALDANAERRIAVRRQALASLPDYQALRQRAHAVRVDAIANLDGYLERFIDKARQNGLVVHRASDAAQANQIVLDIARRVGASLGRSPLVAKSKTMVSEEIGLNHALESAGLRVVETDLGEYIVQLRGEPPSHIITPAVHLRRSDVGETFHEKLGIPRTDDIPTLTTAARSALREVFLDTTIGVSGVNFGVAETGTLCVITNEGNGRMVTTLPPVHIALMGIERLVPTVDDLAVMLALLPRSATGQKITVYTNLIHAPRRPGDPDGPEERHLILVDNGRSAVRGSQLAEILYCIRCGACLNACPVFREIGGHAYVSVAGKSSTYPGPMGSVVSPALFGVPEFGHLARASSLCGACQEACPVDIDLPGLLLRIRAGRVSSPETGFTGSAGFQGAGVSNAPRLLAWGLRLYTWVATSPWRFEVAQRLAGFFSRIVSPFTPSKTPQGGAWLRLPALTGWGYSKDFPQPARRPFRVRFKSTDVPGERAGSVEQVGKSPSVDEVLAPRPAISLSSSELVDRFAAELEALSGSFRLCRREDLSRDIASLLKQKGVPAIQAWQAEHLPIGLLDELRGAGIQVSHEPDPELQAGLTGALGAIAETGTLVLPGGPGRPLTASLLPAMHIAVIEASRIYPALAEVLDLPEVQGASAVVLVSGPSRTADIEMTLTIGVHGPGELYVFCVT